MNNKTIWIIVILIVGASMIYTPSNSKITPLGEGKYLYQVYSDKPSALFSILYSLGYPATPNAIQGQSTGFINYDSSERFPYDCGSASYLAYGLSTTSSVTERARMWIDFDINSLSNVDGTKIVDSVNLKLATSSKTGSGTSDTINYVRALPNGGTSFNCPSKSQADKQSFFSELDSGTPYLSLTSSSRISSSPIGAYASYDLAASKSDIETSLNSGKNTFSLAITTSEDGTRDKLERIVSPKTNPSLGPILEIEYHIESACISFENLMSYANSWVNGGIAFQTLMDYANQWVACN